MPFGFTAKISGGGGGGGGSPALYADAYPVESAEIVIAPAAFIASPALVCIATGGTPPYSYVWTAISNPGGMTITSPNGSSTTVSKAISGYQTLTSTFRCAVTDSAGSPATVNTNIVTVSLTRESNA